MPALSDNAVRLIHSGLLLPSDEAIAKMQREITIYGETPEDTPVLMARQIRALRGDPNPDLI